MAGPPRKRLIPRFAETYGPEALFGFQAGDVDVAYAGSTPFLLARSYGLPIRIVGITHETRVGVALRNHERLLEQPFIKIATIFGSNPHQLLSVWAQTINATVALVNLSPSDCVRALESGIVDGLATGEPQLTIAEQLGATLVFSSDDLDKSWFNVMVAADDAIRCKPQLVLDYLAADGDAVRAIAWEAPEQDLEFLSGIYHSKLMPDEFVRLLRHGYNWLGEQITEPLPDDHPLCQSLAATLEFLVELGLLGSDQLDLSDCFPAAWPQSRRSGDDMLRVGYSESLMSAPYLVAQHFGYFEERDLHIESDERPLKERIAAFDSEYRKDLEVAESLLDTDVAAALMVLGRMTEHVFAEIYKKTISPTLPEQASATAQELEGKEVLPKTVASSGHWIRVHRNAAAHPQAWSVTRTQARSAYLQGVEILDWFHANRARLELMAATCIQCARPIQSDWKVCAYCGSPQELECGRCKQRLEAAWQACPRCGAAVAEGSLTPP